MNSDAYWKLFLATGSPEAYLAYHEAKRMEHTHVLEHERPGAAGHTLQ